jgi:hypothetical protein
MVIFVDVIEPLSCIGGTDGVHDIDSEEDISTIHDTGTLLYPLPDIITGVFRHRPSVRRLRCYSMIYRFWICTESHQAGCHVSKRA